MNTTVLCVSIYSEVIKGQNKDGRRAVAGELLCLITMSEKYASGLSHRSVLLYSF